MDRLPAEIIAYIYEFNCMGMFNANVCKYIYESAMSGHLYSSMMVHRKLFRDVVNEIGKIKYTIFPAYHADGESNIYKVMTNHQSNREYKYLTIYQYIISSRREFDGRVDKITNRLYAVNDYSKVYKNIDFYYDIQQDGYVYNKIHNKYSSMSFEEETSITAVGIVDCEDGDFVEIYLEDILMDKNKTVERHLLL